MLRLQNTCMEILHRAFEVWLQDSCLGSIRSRRRSLALRNKALALVNEVQSGWEIFERMNKPSLLRTLLLWLSLVVKEDRSEKSTSVHDTPCPQETL